MTYSIVRPYRPDYSEDMRFVDRIEAGQELAERLLGYKHHAVVYGLPRGGVPVAAAVAKALCAPLDVIIARKIGHPYSPEYAVAERSPAIWNELELPTLEGTWRRQAVADEQREARHRRQVYLAGRKHISPAHKTAILVDDGMATGLTMLAAVQEAKKLHPLRLVVAVPCASTEAIARLLEEADEVVVLTDPAGFLGAVAAYYDDFPQLSDEEVINLLENY